MFLNWLLLFLYRLFENVIDHVEYHISNNTGIAIDKYYEYFNRDMVDWFGGRRIEKAIHEANLGITPTNNGEMVILTIPELNEERRKDYVKQVKGMGEDAKVALRNAREDARNQVKKAELPEDEEDMYNEEIQELITKYNKLVDEKVKEKETELMSV